jgi:hypothetical protein
MEKSTIAPVSAPASGTRAMIRNNSGGSLINKNSVAESTLTGLPICQCSCVKARREKPAKYRSNMARSSLSHSNASFRRNGTSFVDDAY